MAAFIAEDGAIDALLSAIVDKLSPNKHGVSVSCTEDDVLAGANELTSFSAVSVSVRAVMALIEFHACFVAILRNVPDRGGAHVPVIALQHGRCRLRRSFAYLIVEIFDPPQIEPIERAIAPIPFAPFVVRALVGWLSWRELLEDEKNRVWVCRGHQVFSSLSGAVAQNLPKLKPNTKAIDISKRMIIGSIFDTSSRIDYQGFLKRQNSRDGEKIWTISPTAGDVTLGDPRPKGYVTREGINDRLP